MPLPKYIVRLTDEERTDLEDLIHTGKHRAAATLIHARILLKADVGVLGAGVERIAEFFHRIRLERYLAVSPSALRSLRTQMEEVLLAYQAEQEQQIGQTARRVPLIAGADETFFERVILVRMD